MKSFNIYLGHCETVLLIIAFLVICFPTFSLQQTRGEPVNVGFIVALPWDISNTLRAPIGGPVSVMLTAISAAALLLGFLLAPVHYLMGYPSRIYHPARQPGLISEYLYIDKTERSFGDESSTDLITLATMNNRNLSFSGNIESRSFKDDTGNVFTGEDDPLKQSEFPDFISSAFMFMPEQDTECRKLFLCHAHGFLQSLPGKFTKFLRFFSKRAMFVPEEYRSAVKVGLGSQKDCVKTYKCQREISAIMKDILFDLISSDFKHLWNLRKLF